jgi:AAA+ ATPase superfamily predicted ATPase
MEIIGRHNEKYALQQYLESDKSEFVAVFGRRRVGKTFLIKAFFENSFSFYISGMANATKAEQIENFNATLTFYGKMPYPRVKSWMESFRQLIHLLEHSKKRGKKIIFIDELPWFDTPRSGFITGLEYFWNTWASARSDILLITCGSATSWMINKLLKNRGGLHNRVTRRMALEPFSLAECGEFFQHKKIVLNRKSIVECYMIFGGIPFDLLIDRNDGIINLCEMKYSDDEFVIDKKQDENLRNKKSAFMREAKTRKAVHITMVTIYGVKRNEYWGSIQSEVKDVTLYLSELSIATQSQKPRLHKMPDRGDRFV